MTCYAKENLARALCLVVSSAALQQRNQVKLQVSWTHFAFLRNLFFPFSLAEDFTQGFFVDFLASLQEPF